MVVCSVALLRVSWVCWSHLLGARVEVLLSRIGHGGRGYSVGSVERRGLGRRGIVGLLVWLHFLVRALLPARGLGGLVVLLLMGLLLLPLVGAALDLDWLDFLNCDGLLGSLERFGVLSLAVALHFNFEFSVREGIKR
jgi:hypothetical protein